MTPTPTATTSTTTEETGANRRWAFLVWVAVLMVVIIMHQQLELELELPAGDMETKSVRNDQSKGTTASSGLPFRFPETKFTTHVQSIISIIEDVTLHASPKATKLPFPYHPMARCKWSFRVVLDEPHTRPSRIECSPDYLGQKYCTFFKHLFQNKSRILPYNVTIGASGEDKILKDSAAWGQCLGSSAPQGRFSMNNFQDVREYANLRQSRDPLKANATGYIHKHKLSWADRQSIPIFRGEPRLLEYGPMMKNPDLCPPKANDLNRRIKAAAFSLEHPELLDAVVSPQPHAVCTIHSATNGLDKIFRWGKYGKNTTGLPPVRIPPQEYYTNYQTAVVLGGIGAAFRTSRHLSAGQAVVLQKYPWEEWFTKYMIPYKHYIPLANDLLDLEEVMNWVQKFPGRVKKIAAHGQNFYEEYLSFAQNEEHWYELLWRLSLTIHEQGSDKLKKGSGRDIWPAPEVPMTLQRTPEGSYKEIDVSALFKEEDAALARRGN